MKSRGFTLIELMIVIAIIAIIAAIAIPNIIAAQMTSRESAVRGSLKTLSTVAVQFKDKYRAYLILNIFGMRYCRTPGAATYDEFIKNEAIANADRHIPAVVTTLINGDGMNVEVGVAAPPASPTMFRGHYFHVLNGFVQAGVNKPYHERANGGVGIDGADTGLPCNQNKWGAVAWPNTWASDGRFVFIADEGGVVYRKDPGGALTYSVGALGACSLTPVTTAGGVNYMWFPEQPTAAGFASD